MPFDITSSNNSSLWEEKISIALFKALTMAARRSDKLFASFGIAIIIAYYLPNALYSQKSRE
jgi:hypothetical protein